MLFLCCGISLDDFVTGDRSEIDTFPMLAGGARLRQHSGWVLIIQLLRPYSNSQTCLQELK